MEQKGESTLAKPALVYKLSDALQQAVSGKFRWMLLLIVGSVNAILSAQVTMMTFLLPILKTVWDLESPLDSMIGIAFFIGVLCASLMWPILADKYGRVLVTIISTNLMAVSTTAIIFTNNIWYLLVFRFLSGLGWISPVTLTLVMEFSPVKARSKNMVIIFASWTLGGIISVILAWIAIGHEDLETGWRMYVLATAIWSWMVSIAVLWLPESARWYSTIGDFDKAEKVINQVYKINRKDPIKGHMFKENKVIVARGDVRDVFAPKYLKTSCILIFNMVAIIMVYEGVLFISERLFQHSSLYMCEIVTMTSEFSVIGFGLLMERIGLRWMMMYTSFVPAICLAIAAVLWGYVPSISYIWMINLILIFAARGFSYNALLVQLTYFSVYYPTAIRATAVGLGFGITKFGSMLTIYITEDRKIPTGLAILTTISLLSFVLSYFIDDISINNKLTNFVDRSGSTREISDGDSAKTEKSKYVLHS